MASNECRWRGHIKNYKFRDKDFEHFIIYATAELKLDIQGSEVHANQELLPKDKIQVLNRIDHFRDWNLEMLIKSTLQLAGLNEKTAEEVKGQVEYE